MVDAIVGQGIEGRTVLEPGGGVGAIPIELLKAGASEACVVELSHGYDEAAAVLSQEAGFEGRVTRRHGDFVADDADAADVVVLHRVVCCYPDHARLLATAAEKARHTLVYTYPARNLCSRLAIASANLWLRLRGNAFRAFAHEPAAMESIVVGAGFEPVERRRRGIWRGVAFVRTT